MKLYFRKSPCYLNSSNQFFYKVLSAKHVMLLSLILRGTERQRGEKNKKTKNFCNKTNIYEPKISTSR